ncbi:hypothetical protein [Allonocardiopsis opalescens]|uniref:Lar family restriction alleviation protein n=1 Tax=Allonocardiopsis opalescens TaxID=1144618 RepID=A0A2T0PP64_9ACTN|nr:hypothetical protein [Allonocardiopsis opalescens]PRX90691.1 hypothetical protein CLV72_11829 [Allonocardiopsis opalescens]
MSTSLIICRPSEFLRRTVQYCPTCKRRRRFSIRTAAWYGARVTCCGCGDSWADGERMERPFRRGWRAEAIEKAKADWVAAGPFNRQAWDRWFAEQMGAAEDGGAS